MTRLHHVPPGVRCPTCDAGATAMLIVIDSLRVPAHQDLINGLLARASAVGPETPDPAEATGVDRLAYCIVDVVHQLGHLIEGIAGRSAIYALHQVVRIEDGSERGPVVPMMCLACVLSENAVDTNVPHICRKPARA